MTVPGLHNTSPQLLGHQSSHTQWLSPGYTTPVHTSWDTSHLTQWRYEGYTTPVHRSWHTSHLTHSDGIEVTQHQSTAPGTRVITHTVTVWGLHNTSPQLLRHESSHTQWRYRGYITPVHSSWDTSHLTNSDGTGVTQHQSTAPGAWVISHTETVPGLHNTSPQLLGHESSQTVRVPGLHNTSLQLLRHKSSHTQWLSHWLNNTWFNPSSLGVGYITPTKHLTRDFTSLVSLTQVSI